MEKEQVNHPDHYNQYEGLEIIDLVELMPFNLGNAVKYIARAGHKDPATEIQDLKKAVFYIRREMDRAQHNRPEPRKYKGLDKILYEQMGGDRGCSVFHVCAETPMNLQIAVNILEEVISLLERKS